MPYPVFVAGQKVTAALLAATQWQEIEQGIDQTVTNSTSFVDTNIIIPVEAGARYQYTLLAGYSSSTTADIKFSWTAPTGGEVRRWTIAQGQNGTGGVNTFSEVSMRYATTTNQVVAGGSGTGNEHAYIEIGVINGGAGGNVTLQFAQVTAEATNTVFLAESRISYVRIE